MANIDILLTNFKFFKNFVFISIKLKFQINLKKLTLAIDGRQITYPLSNQAVQKIGLFMAVGGDFGLSDPIWLEERDENGRMFNYMINADAYISSLRKIKAEIYLCYSIIKKQAAENSQSVENEGVRVMIHGALHCMGYNDKSDKEKKLMTDKENSFLKMFHVKQFNNV